MAIEGMRSYDDFCHDNGEDEPTEQDERENAEALDEEERYRLAEYIKTLSGAERMRLQCWVKKHQAALAPPPSYSETFRRLESLVPDNTSFSLRIETWSHVLDGVRGKPSLRWEIYTTTDHGEGQFFHGNTAEAAINAYLSDNAPETTVEEVEL